MSNGKGVQGGIGLWATSWLPSARDSTGGVRAIDDGAGVQVVLVVEDETVHFHNQVADL